MDTTNSKNATLKKNALLLIVALVFGAIAFWLSKQHLAQKEAELAASLQGKAVQMMAIVVASVDIPEGSSVNGNNLAVAEITAAHVPLDVITPDEFETIDGRTALRNVPKGKPILKSYISSTLTERFSDLLSIGQRALTFSVDSLNSSDGMLKPGDKVDLFLLSAAAVGPENVNEKELIPLLQNIDVLATGKTPVVPLPDQNMEDQYNNAQYNTLTVAVSPQQAQKVLLAKDNGTIVTLLRNRNDGQQLPASVMHYATLKNNGNQVEYFSGSKTEAGSLKAELKPVHSITPPPEFPLQHWKSNSKNTTPTVAVNK